MLLKCLLSCAFLACLTTSLKLEAQPVTRPLDMVIFNVDQVKTITSPFSEGVLFQPMLHPTRQDGSAIDLQKGAPQIHHSTARFTIKPGYGWPKTKFTISEMYYITSGSGEITISDKSYPVKKGDLIYVAPGLERAIRNNSNSDLVYLSITDPEWSPEAETNE